MGLGQGYRKGVSSKHSILSPARTDLYSVNLGGWLVTERKHVHLNHGPQTDNLAFIVPALYERYQNSTPKAIDEYTLSQA